MTRPICSECGVVIDGPMENDPEIAPHHPIGDGYPSACVRALRAEIARLREQLAAERERCARVAETTNVVSDGQADTWFDGVERALLTVAANIRRG